MIWYCGILYDSHNTLNMANIYKNCKQKVHLLDLYKTAPTMFKNTLEKRFLFPYHHLEKGHKNTLAKIPTYSLTFPLYCSRQHVSDYAYKRTAC